MSQSQGAETDNGPTSRPIVRARGTTSAERHVASVCERSFLSLWSYPEVYRDQGNAGHGGDGKELCDLLVVFENHVLIFSDKDCKYPSTDDVDTNWARWYRKAIKEAAQQLWGAERWIKNFPNRVFVDRACTQTFPIKFPEQPTFHRIIVAHGVGEASRQALGGSGSLMIVPSIVGDDHLLKVADGGQPFAVGQVDPARGYVHVLDDVTFDILLSTLDTITDLVEYVSKKERLILSGRLAAATGEEDLLAIYLARLDADGTHGFDLFSGYDFVGIEEGHWEDFVRSQQRWAQVRANEVSYAWDALIETFAKNLLAGTQYYGTFDTIREQEIILRLMARETRTRRRLLAGGLLDLISTTPKNYKAVRVILPSHKGDPYYVFLLVPHLPSVDETDYREVRRSLLDMYCRVVRANNGDALDIVGIATEAGTGQYRSEDAAYLDTREWTAEQQAEAEQFKNEFGVLRDARQTFRDTIYEYPVQPQPRIARGSENTRLKGRDRNSRCPCGSGRKFKRCCGA